MLIKTEYYNYFIKGLFHHTKHLKSDVNTPYLSKASAHF